MYCEMTPPVGDSVVSFAPNRCRIGSSMLLECGYPKYPESVMTTRTTDSGEQYHLSHMDQDFLDADTDTSYPSETGRVHQAGTGAAMWAFMGVHIKAKAWISGLQSEHENIDCVNKKTSIPTPQVLFSWVDAKWNRTFLIMESIKGRTLDQAWPDLTSPTKLRIAHRIASYCADLAASTSRRMETVGGQGVCEDFLLKPAPSFEPSWKPVVQGGFTAAELTAYLGDTSLAIEPDFVLYHADLGPPNIILNDQAEVTAVIGWESLAFYPRFWVATKPLFSAGFNLSRSSDRSEWARLLTNALEEKGFKDEEHFYRRWKAAIKGV